MQVMQVMQVSQVMLVMKVLQVSQVSQVIHVKQLYLGHLWVELFKGEKSTQIECMGGGIWVLEGLPLSFKGPVVGKDCFFSQFGIFHDKLENIIVRIEMNRILTKLRCSNAPPRNWRQSHLPNHKAQAA